MRIKWTIFGSPKERSSRSSWTRESALMGKHSAARCVPLTTSTGNVQFHFLSRFMTSPRDSSCFGVAFRLWFASKPFTVWRALTMSKYLKSEKSFLNFDWLSARWFRVSGSLLRYIDPYACSCIIKKSFRERETSNKGRRRSIEWTRWPVIKLHSLGSSPSSPISLVVFPFKFRSSELWHFPLSTFHCSVNSINRADENRIVFLAIWERKRRQRVVTES